MVEGKDRRFAIAQRTHVHDPRPRPTLITLLRRSVTGVVTVWENRMPELLTPLPTAGDRATA